MRDLVVGRHAFSEKGEHFISELIGLIGDSEGETTFFCFLSYAEIKFLQPFKLVEAGSQVCSEHPSQQTRYSTFPPLMPFVHYFCDPKFSFFVFCFRLPG